MPNETARTAPTQRDMHLQLIAERGRMAWQKASGYNRRALVEADISRYKRVIGDALRSDTDDRQATEVAIAVGVLNRMLEPGRPKSVRITEETTIHDRSASLSSSKQQGRACTKSRAILACSSSGCTLSGF
jgi:hypothetical protein